MRLIILILCILPRVTCEPVLSSVDDSEWSSNQTIAARVKQTASWTRIYDLGTEIFTHLIVSILSVNSPFVLAGGGSLDRWCAHVLSQFHGRRRAYHTPSVSSSLQQMMH